MPVSAGALAQQRRATHCSPAWRAPAPAPPTRAAGPGAARTHPRGQAQEAPRAGSARTPPARWRHPWGAAPAAPRELQAGAHSGGTACFAVALMRQCGAQASAGRGPELPPAAHVHACCHSAAQGPPRGSEQYKSASDDRHKRQVTTPLPRCAAGRVASTRRGWWRRMAPLHTAAKQGDLEAVQAALSSGADVNGKDSVRARAGATGQCIRSARLGGAGARTQAAAMPRTRKSARPIWRTSALPRALAALRACAAGCVTSTRLPGGCAQAARGRRDSSLRPARFLRAHRTVRQRARLTRRAACRAATRR
jgi:hypothetical protein